MRRTEYKKTVDMTKEKITSTKNTEYYNDKNNMTTKKGVCEIMRKISIVVITINGVDE